MERNSKHLEKAKESRRRSPCPTPPRIPEPNFTKIDTLVTYGDGFGCSIYG
jgi:hypothetical protein